MLNLPHLTAKDLGPLIISDIYQWKTPDRSFENYEKLCDAIGNKKIPFEDFESLFNQFSKEIYTNKSADIQKTKEQVRWCVLSDLIHEKIIDKIYSNLVEIFGNDVVSRKKFEKWLVWSKTRLVSKSLTFADLPLDIIRLIIRLADTDTHFRAQLRKLCHFLKVEIDQLGSKCKDICVDFGPDFIDFNGKIAEETVISPAVYSKYVMEDLAFVLRNRKLRLNTFTTSYNPVLDHVKWRDRFETLLKTLTRKIPVKDCTLLVKNQYDVVAILPYLKPGELKTLTINRDADDGWILLIDKIVSLPQWKRARHVFFGGRIVASLNDFCHFATFEISLFLCHPEAVIRMSRALSRSKRFQTCTIHTSDRLDIGGIFRGLDLRRTDTPNVFSIPRTELTFVFLDDGHAFKVTHV